MIKHSNPKSTIKITHQKSKGTFTIGFFANITLSLGSSCVLAKEQLPH